MLVTEHDVLPGLGRLIGEITGTPASEITMDEILDPAFLAEIVVAAKHDYNLDLTDDERGGLKTVGDLVGLILS
ncbi:hypothetical protein GCM10022252_12700 [Streptosporangium oxazolinicum]|uniref:Acyl carrier protein n=1 Tax=Streptosporangium oxazolinicum TaxID=909287 RepID=A0ABP8AI42_9ACTN